MTNLTEGVRVAILLGFLAVAALALVVTFLACSGLKQSDDLLTPLPSPSPTVTPSPTPVPTPTAMPRSWSRPVSTDVPAAMATPSGFGRIQVHPKGLGVEGGAREDLDGGPEACVAVPVEKLRPTEVLRCAERALLEASGVRIETYAHVANEEDGQPRVSVETEGVYASPDRMKAKLLLTLWGDSQHRSDLIQIADVRYLRSQNYNQVSGERVVTAGWSEEMVDGADRRSILGIVGLDYATRFVADRGGLDAPEDRRCGDSTIRLVEPDTADDRTHLMVEVRSSEVAGDGVPCRGAMLMTVTHWIDRVTFRPWRVLLEAVPLNGEGPVSLDGRMYWRGQTVYSNYDVEFAIEPPT